MAGFAGMSQSNFRRRFEEYAGMPPKLYIDKLKMRMAAELLASSSSTLAQTAAALGYVDQFHFARRFKAIMGSSPGAYRKALGLFSR
jgi:AraC-like DNA-binding protein